MLIIKTGWVAIVICAARVGVPIISVAIVVDGGEVAEAVLEILEEGDAS